MNRNSFEMIETKVVYILRKVIKAPLNCKIFTNCCEDLMFVLCNNRYYAIGSIDIIDGQAFFNTTIVDVKHIIENIEDSTGSENVSLQL